MSVEDEYAAAAASLDESEETAQPVEVAPCYLSVTEWVEREFAPVFTRRITPAFRWCPQWWRHPEAISRLTEMWRSWEVLRLDPLLGMGAWYEHHLDHHLPRLTATDGRFESCDGAKARHFKPSLTVLPTDPAPPGWWPPPPAGDGD